MTENEKARRISPGFDTTREAYEYLSAENQGATVDRIIGRDTPTAHEMTTDEREALDYAIRAVQDSVVAAGFRRSEAPEPSGGQVNDVLVLLEDAIDNIDYPGADALEWISKAKAHAATLARWARPEPQGEPSDAEVEAAARAMVERVGAIWPDDLSVEEKANFLDDARAALRAAEEVRS